MRKNKMVVSIVAAAMMITVMAMPVLAEKKNEKPIDYTKQFDSCAVIRSRSG